ncbi:MAG: DUF4377 domain-containing protein [Phocaeicola sp.]
MKYLLVVKHFICLLLLTTLVGCSLKNKEQERTVTDYLEYEIVVASKKVPGLVGSGMYAVADLYAVKIADAQEWTPFTASLPDFEYEEGFEYRLKVSQTNYLDYRMGDPAWSEYALLEVLSKEEHASQGLPGDFIPTWYKERNP